MSVDSISLEKYMCALPPESKPGYIAKANHWIKQVREVPEMIQKGCDFTVQLLSFTSLEESLKLIKPFIQEIGSFMQLSKGMQTIDGVVNFKLSFKHCLLTLAGLSLLILNVMSYLSKLDLWDMTPVKVALAAIPIFGILPFGGVIAFSIGILRISACLGAIQKYLALQKEKTRREEKLQKWNESCAESIQKVWTDKLYACKQRKQNLEAIQEEASKINAQTAIQHLNEDIEAIDKKIQKYKDNINKLELENFKGIQGDKQNKWSQKIKRISDGISLHNAFLAAKCTDLFLSVISIACPLLGVAKKQINASKLSLGLLSFALSTYHFAYKNFGQRETAK